MKNNSKYRLCKCGRKIYKPYNSTIWPKECNYCLKIKRNKQLLITAYKNTRLDRINSTSGAKTKQKSKKFDFYKTKAWKLCSHYVLLYYANDDLMVQCSTSGKWLKITDKNCHCGHFIKVKDGSKSHYSTSLLFENLAPQSLQENRYMGGRPEVMKEWLINKHGKEKIDNLEIIKNNVCHPDVLFLEYWEKYWEKMYEELLYKKNKENPWRK